MHLCIISTSIVAIHMKKIGSYVYFGGGSAKITDFKQKIQKIAFRKHVFRIRSTFPQMENLKQGVFGGL